MINLKCYQDPAELGIINSGGLNILAFWDHVDSCDKCQEAKVALVDELNKVMSGEQELGKIMSGQR